LGRKFEINLIKVLYLWY